MEVNVFANVALYQAAMPYMRQSKGKIVIISSYAGSLGFPLFSEYSASKHALEGFLNVARVEASQWGIPVTIIVPGGVKTGMTSDLPAKLYARLGQLGSADADRYRAYFEQYVQLMTASVDTFADPDAVAKCVVESVMAERPEIRYVVGEDAAALIGQKKTLTEEEFDALLRKMFPGSGYEVPK
jgi:NAD(P)-dependent dehydrogenase (short-subunit alcohol dehydrogenase family)